MAEASGAPTTPSQLIGIGMIEITNTNIFASDTRRWNEKSLLQKTWKAFKLHFYQAQNSIKKAHPQQSLYSIGFYKSANATTISDE